MARVFCTYTHEFNVATVGPVTILQIEAPGSQRVVIPHVELIPLGATAATAPLLFDLTKQSDANGLSDDTAQIVKLPPVPGDAGLPRTKAYKRAGAGAEPASVAGGVGFYQMSVHQMGSRGWQPTNPFREQVIESTGRVGIRYAGSANPNISIRVQVVFEE